jgi:hypothetical protein
LKNKGNIQENLYNFAVIEFIGHGMHAEAKQEMWFYWNKDEWKICGRPHELDGINNWAIG